jgi:hypothetical protein
MDNIHVTAVVADPSYKVPEYAGPQALKTAWELAGIALPTWTSDMKSLFEAGNLRNVKHTKPIMKGSVVQPITQCALMGWEEARQTVLAKYPGRKETAERLQEALKIAQMEFYEKGVGVDPVILRCIGMKPQS